MAVRAAPQASNLKPQTGTEPSIPPDVLRRVRQIEIRSRRLVNQLFSGSYQAIFRGRGMEFAEVREYQPGDEVRTIDWNVTARLGEPFVKRFVEERELTVMLAVDISPSQAFGTARQTKREVAAEIAAILALAAVRNNDKVGLVLFTDRIETVVPPKKGMRHALRIVREVLYGEPTGRGTSVRAAVEYVSRLLHRRSIVFLMSDFLDTGYERALRVAGRRHDVIAVTATDPREVQLVNAGLIEVEDAETGAFALIDTGSKKLREQYAARTAAQRSDRRRALRQARVDQIDVATDAPYAKPLLAYFQRRVRLAAAGGSGRFASRRR